MKGLLALTLALTLAATAFAAAQPRSGAPRAQHVRLTASRGACSIAANCVQGCALYVAGTPRPSGSPTAPCANQAASSCSEYVASSPAPPATFAPACIEAGARFPHRILPPSRRAEELRARARRALRSLEARRRGKSAPRGR